jgi:hypothetical protein
VAGSIGQLRRFAANKVRRRPTWSDMPIIADAVCPPFLRALLAWLQTERRIVVRYKEYGAQYRAVVVLDCVRIFLRRCV